MRKRDLRMRLYVELQILEFSNYNSLKSSEGRERNSKEQRLKIILHYLTKSKNISVEINKNKTKWNGWLY